MLDVGLCMTVRDEAENIVDCLSGIAHMFTKVVVIDTGSRDATPDLLRDTLGIEPLFIALEQKRCGALADARNHGFDSLGTPWLMTLDADERIDPAELAQVLALADGDLPGGLFCAWDTDEGNGGALIEDYKLCFFRGRFRHMGLIHDTAQPSLRQSGEHADWWPDLRIRHFPIVARRDAKDSSYADRLACARECDPDWLRYWWFTGYQAWRRGDLAQARLMLGEVHNARPALFPVESLNASMVLAKIAADAGDGAAALALLDDALAFHRLFADDFEVQVNRRLGPWLESARNSAAAGELAAIDPYRFPY